MKTLLRLIAVAAVAVSIHLSGYAQGGRIILSTDDVQLNMTSQYYTTINIWTNFDLSDLTFNFTDPEVAEVRFTSGDFANGNMGIYGKKGGLTKLSVTHPGTAATAYTWVHVVEGGVRPQEVAFPEKRYFMTRRAGYTDLQVYSYPENANLSMLELSSSHPELIGVGVIGNCLRLYPTDKWMSGNEKEVTITLGDASCKIVKLDSEGQKAWATSYYIPMGVLAKNKSAEIRYYWNNDVQLDGPWAVTWVSNNNSVMEVKDSYHGIFTGKESGASDISYTITGYCPSGGGGMRPRTCSASAQWDVADVPLYGPATAVYTLKDNITLKVGQFYRLQAGVHCGGELNPDDGSYSGFDYTPGVKFSDSTIAACVCHELGYNGGLVFYGLKAGTTTATLYGGGLEYPIAITVTEDGSGLEAPEVEADANSPVEYYNLQGIRVDNPSGGIFIRRQGNNVTKVRL